MKSLDATEFYSSFDEIEDVRELIDLCFDFNGVHTIVQCSVKCTAAGSKIPTVGVDRPNTFLSILDLCRHRVEVIFNIEENSV